MKRRATISTEQETRDLEAALEKLNQATVKAKAPVVQAVAPVAAPVTQEEETAKQTHRYNIEIPLELFEEIKAHIGETGQNLKGFFLKSAQFYMKNNLKE
jgi:cell division septum initiation protein DivIVA